MDDQDRTIAKLEARLRALEALIQAVPQVFTQEVFEATEREMRRRYDHPLAAEDSVPIAEVRELEAEAFNEIWREMKDLADYPPPAS